MNDIKPIWQRPSKEVEEDEYKAFYKSFSKESDDPMAYIHFTAEGEVTFKSILFVPTSAPRGLFDEYGSKRVITLSSMCAVYSSQTTSMI